MLETEPSPEKFLKILEQAPLSEAEQTLEQTREQLKNFRDFSEEKWRGTLDYLTTTIQNLENYTARMEEMTERGFATDEQKKELAEGVKPLLEELKKQRDDVDALVLSFEEKVAKKAG